MATTSFSTTNQLLRDLLGNGLTYQVPLYQRDYSWDEEQWEDLWEDLQTVHRGEEPVHYMGYLVLQTRDNRLYEIIDGQQRLTTLSLLVLAVIKRLEILAAEEEDPANNRLRSQQLHSSYIGYLDPVTLVAQTKLRLNRNNDFFYQTYLAPREPLPQRGLKASEHLLRRAFSWFLGKLQPIRNGQELARFVDMAAYCLLFTVITVTDELNAFKVFETLNARGVRLSAIDLLKNFLFSVVHQGGGHTIEMDRLENYWERLLAQLGGESFTDFVRTHWNSRYPFVRQTDLFKTIRQKIQDRGDVFRLLREFEEDLETYLALTAPSDPLWRDPSERRAVEELRMFSVRQPYPLLLAAKRQLPAADFQRILQACSVIAFRYNVIGALAGSEQERVYNRVAERVGKGELTSAAVVLPELRSIYVSDEAFRGAFAEKQLKTTLPRNKKIVRYLLFALESRLSEQEYDPDSDRYSLEHILPESPGDGWEGFTEEEIERSVYRLGNMTLLESARNRDLGNQSYAEKRTVYAQSGFVLTRKLAEESAEWTPDRIASRQRQMAQTAVGRWRLDRL